MPLPLVLGLALVTAAEHPLAHARSSIADIRWEAPAECPSRESVLEAVTVLLGGETGALVPVSVHAKIESSGAQYRLELAWRSEGEEQRRSMTAASCEELARAAALMLSLAASPARARAQAEATTPDRTPENLESEIAPKAPPAPATVQTAERRPPRAPRVESNAAPRTSPVSVEARAGARLDVGSLPRAALGATLGMTIHSPGLAGFGELSVFHPQTAVSQGRRGGFWLMSLALRPCVERAFARVHVAPCAAFGLDAIAGQGQNLDRNRAGWGFFPRFGLALEAWLRLAGPIGAFAGVEASGAPFRPTFRLDDGTLVHRPERWAMRAAAGISLGL